MIPEKTIIPATGVLVGGILVGVAVGVSVGLGTAVGGTGIGVAVEVGGTSVGVGVGFGRDGKTIPTFMLTTPVVNVICLAEYSTNTALPIPGGFFNVTV